MTLHCIALRRLFETARTPLHALFSLLGFCQSRRYALDTIITTSLMAIRLCRRRGTKTSTTTFHPSLLQSVMHSCIHSLLLLPIAILILEPGLCIRREAPMFLERAYCCCCYRRSPAASLACMCRAQRERRWRTGLFEADCVRSCVSYERARARIHTHTHTHTHSHSHIYVYIYPSIHPSIHPSFHRIGTELFPRERTPRASVSCWLEHKAACAAAIGQRAHAQCRAVCVRVRRSL